VRPLLKLALVLAILPASASAAPTFAPNPRQAFEGFAAINPPRADVPVGALWINDYGPTGDGAGKDNLETVRSLNGVTIDKNMQLSLSLGLFQLFGIDPKARDHYTAHFTDLSLVRVKDMGALTGPKGEPRIIEALKAGSVSISSDTEIGLNGQNAVWQRGTVQASGNADRSRVYSIEARDMFIAIHVATPEITQSKEQVLRIADDGASARIDDFLIAIRQGHCVQTASCKPELGVMKINTQMPANVATSPLEPSDSVGLPLPVPISDGQGGLYTKLALHWIAPCSEGKKGGCGKTSRIIAQYEGARLQDLPKIEAKGW
jgi:hypothetical protein